MSKRDSAPRAKDGNETSPASIDTSKMIKLPTLFLIRVQLERYLQTDKQWLRDCMGEFLGTTLLVAIICGNAAQAVLSKGSASGGFFPTSFVTGMAITFGVYLSGNTSGGHINPAVTMVMVLVGRTTWRMLPLYWLAQYLGAFVGAALVHAVYYDAMNHFDGGVRRVFGPNATAGIFATYPQSYLSTGDGWFDQVVGTAVLTMCVFAVHDERNVEIPKYLLPLIVGLVVNMIGMAFGWNCGFPINPARDLGPRIYTAIAGWGRNVFRYRYYNWFWATLIGPHVGAILGTVFYMLFVGIHWPATFDRNYQEIRKASATAMEIPNFADPGTRRVSFSPHHTPHKQSLGSVPEIRVEPEMPSQIRCQKPTATPQFKEFQFDKEIKIIIPLVEVVEDELEDKVEQNNFANGQATTKF